MSLELQFERDKNKTLETKVSLILCSCQLEPVACWKVLTIATLSLVFESCYQV